MAEQEFDENVVRDECLAIHEYVKGRVIAGVNLVSLMQAYSIMFGAFAHRMGAPGKASVLFNAMQISAAQSFVAATEYKEDEEEKSDEEGVIDPEMLKFMKMEVAGRG